MIGARHELEVLRWHWGSFYEIAADDEWSAKRRDDGEILTAASPGDLRHLIHEDFAARPVPRLSQH